MKSINLLPKTSWIQRYFIAVMALSVLVSLLLSGAIYYFGDQVRQEWEMATGLQRQLDQELTISKMTTTDPKMASYMAYAAAVEELSTSRIDWQPIVDQVQHLLPSGGEITNPVMSDLVLQLTVRTADKSGLVHYLESLRRAEFVQSAELSAISRVEYPVPDQGQMVVSFQSHFVITIKDGAVW